MIIMIQGYHEQGLVHVSRIPDTHHMSCVSRRPNEHPKGELRLPPEKLQCLATLLHEWNNRRACRHKGMMHLLRYLVFLEAHYQCFLFPTYIDTKDNLSRDNVHSFLSKVLLADSHPSPVSNPLLQLLLDPQADWTSPTWHQQFGATSKLA